MARKTLIHKGYHGSIEVNPKDFTLFGKILFIDENMSYRADTFSELENQFQTLVEKHIKLCEEKGQPPPFT